MLSIFVSIHTVKKTISSGRPFSSNRARTLQSLTGKYRETPVMKIGFPCNESRFFSVGIRIDLQGVPRKPYRVWVYSALITRCKDILTTIIFNSNLIEM